jgi:hypothetical protein
VEEVFGQIMCFSAKHKPSESPLWADMLKVKDIYLNGRSMKVNYGKRTHFWGDTLCGLIPFKNKFPSLFEICDSQDITMSVAVELGWQFTFRR